MGTSPHRAYFPVACNTSDERINENIRGALARGLPLLQGVRPHDGVVVLVGGGPSLTTELWKVREHAKAGHAIVALNGTAKWLRKRGIVPTYHVMMDAREFNANFIERRAKGTHFLLCAQCDPAAFDRVGKRPCTVWMPAIQGYEDFLGDRNTAPVGGPGNTVGLLAMNIMMYLGYREMHLYGYDSCYQGDANHAYSQPENDGETIVNLELSGRKFRAAVWMVHQADDYKVMAHTLAEFFDCEIYAHGDGLLQWMHQEMLRVPHPSAACYDLSRAPASWDFCTWLVRAEMERRMRGAPAPLRVAFQPGPKDGFRDDELPWTPEQRAAFKANVMQPLLRLVGAIEDPLACSGVQHEYTFRPVSELARAGASVPVLVPDEGMLYDVREMLGASPAPITITLREAAHWDHRNSDIPAWTEFARRRMNEGHRVIFIRDTEKADEPLEGFETCPRASVDTLFRAALYDSALINLFVSNGPVELAIFGRRPWLKFKPLIKGWCVGDEAWWPKHVGINAYEQFPWSRPDQRIVWKPDTLENLEDAWREFTETSHQPEHLNVSR